MWKTIFYLINIHLEIKNYILDNFLIRIFIGARLAYEVLPVWSKSLALLMIPLLADQTLNPRLPIDIIFIVFLACSTSVVINSDGFVTIGFCPGASWSSRSRWSSNFIHQAICLNVFTWGTGCILRFVKNSDRTLNWNVVRNPWPVEINISATDNRNFINYHLNWTVEFKE